MSDVSEAAPETPPAPKRQRQYIEPGEPDNKVFAITLVGLAVLVLAGFAYFMIFKFHDVFFEKVVAAM